MCRDYKTFQAKATKPHMFLFVPQWLPAARTRRAAALTTMKDGRDSAPRVEIKRRDVLRFLALMTLQASATNAAVRVADPSAGNNVTTTSTGLQYYDFILPEDDKPAVQPNSTVTVHYTLGTTGARNGWRIDSTYDREPFTFRMGSREVIPGMEEGVLGMRVGGKRRLLIPNTVGYRNANDRPVPKGFAEFQRFKNIYLNPDRAYKPDVVMDVSVLRVR